MYKETAAENLIFLYFVSVFLDSDSINGSLKFLRGERMNSPKLFKGREGDE